MGILRGCRGEMKGENECGEGEIELEGMRGEQSEGEEERKDEDDEFVEWNESW